VATVVLLHGFADDATCWPALVAALRADGHTVVAPDARGHGGQRLPPGGGFTVAEHVADAAAAVDAALTADRRTRSVVLVGHSMGATTAALVAGEHPDLVRGVLLEDPPWPPPRSGALAGAGVRSDLAEWIRGLQATDQDGRLAWVTRTHPGWPPDEYEPWARSKARLDPAVFRVRQSWLGSGWPAAVAAVRCPALLVAGDPTSGSHTALDVDRAVLRRVGWVAFRVTGAGHSVRRDARGWYQALCRAFVRQVG
jgi:pimeloyl-ACP methyl ester carboxylesterase